MFPVSAGAANLVAKQRLQDVGAIASERAAELYGLNVLDRNIQDLSDNVTRFIVLSRCAIPNALPHKMLDHQVKRQTHHAYTLHHFQLHAVRGAM